MTVGITGGTGFVGRSLVERLLSQGNRVKLLARDSVDARRQFPQAEIVEGALGGPASQLQSFVQGVDTLFHCAAEINQQERMYSTNVTGTENLAEAAAGRIRHWVQLSSVDTFGSQPTGVVTESTMRGELNLYEETKLAAELAVMSAASRGSFSYSILRPAKIYGPKMRNQIIYKMINLINKNLFFYIGRPGASANYVHVESVVDALLLCQSESGAVNQAFNLSDYCTIEEMVGFIAEELRRPVSPKRIPEKFARVLARLTSFVPHNLLTTQRVNAMVKRARYSSSKIESVLGFRHRIPLSEGMSELVRTWRSSNAP